MKRSETNISFSPIPEAFCWKSALRMLTPPRDNLSPTHKSLGLLAVEPKVVSWLSLWHQFTLWPRQIKEKLSIVPSLSYKKKRLLRGTKVKKFLRWEIKLLYSRLLNQCLCFSWSSSNFIQAMKLNTDY